MQNWSGGGTHTRKLTTRARKLVKKGTRFMVNGDGDVDGGVGDVDVDRGRGPEEWGDGHFSHYNLSFFVLRVVVVVVAWRVVV